MYRHLGLDEYELKARLAPVVASVLGALAAAVLLLPAPGTQWPSLIVALLALALSRVVTHTVRDRGRRLERRLFAAWGGTPSMAMLRHGDARLPTTVKDRYHGVLAQRVPGLTLPTALEESAAPRAADDAYDAASRWLLEQTRDQSRFRLLFAENMHYGFRRNLLAAKPLGIATDLLALIAIGLVVTLRTDGGGWQLFAEIDPWTWGAGVAAGLHLVWLVAVVRPGWLRAAAERFAEQLLASCDTL